MTDKKKMPADGGGIAKGQPDGVSGSPDTGDMGRVHGRSPGGESGGAAYPNPHSDEESKQRHFFGRAAGERLLWRQPQRDDAAQSRRRRERRDEDFSSDA